MARSRSRRRTKVLPGYERWLRERGVYWDQRLCLQKGKTGWGLFCSESIPPGELLVVVPRAAAFTAEAAPELQAGGLPSAFLHFKEDVDCQLPLAAALLLARASPGWQPKLRPEVTPSSCCLAWNWKNELLVGTELEKPVATKQRRLREEYEMLEPVMRGLGHSLTLEQYTDACAVVLSRVQPWFGGSLVPFVDQANHGDPHVEFRLRKNQA